MPKSSSKMQSWQVFHFARKHLTRSVLYAIFGKKNARAVDYWCEDPKYTAKLDGAYDPIQGVKSLIELLDDHGHCGVVRSTIAYLSAGTSAECTANQRIVEPMSTIVDEILADYRAVANLQRAIEEGLEVEEVEKLMVEAMEELERTFARYKADCLREVMS